MKGASLRWFIKKSTPRAPYYYWQHYTGGRKKGTHRERFLYAALLLPGTSERDDFSLAHCAAGARNPSNFLFTEIKK
jgi:hypothetical protein